MRILYLHQHYSSPAGATATRSHAMARALQARGHAVTIVFGRYAGAETGLEGAFRHGRREGEVKGLRLVEYDIPCGNAQGLGARGGAFLRYAAEAGRLALAGRWDLVIASSTPLTVTLPALLARRLRGTPFVYEMRGLEDLMKISRNPEFGRTDAYRYMTCLLYTSPSPRDS